MPFCGIRKLSGFVAQHGKHLIHGVDEDGVVHIFLHTFHIIADENVDHALVACVHIAVQRLNEHGLARGVPIAEEFQKLLLFGGCGFKGLFLGVFGLGGEVEEGEIAHGVAVVLGQLGAIGGDIGVGEGSSGWRMRRVRRRRGCRCAR